MQVVDGKHRGERGKVIEVRRKENRVVIEGINFVSGCSSAIQKDANQ